MAQLENPRAWWEGSASMIEDDTRIHVGREDVRDACTPGGDIDPVACPGSGIGTWEDVERKAKDGHEGSREFVTEMFFRCWWHDGESVAEEFAAKGWTIDGKPIDRESVADICYEFQTAGYGYAGFGS